jgi:hypothetical protein
MLGSASIGFVLPLVVFTLIFSGRNIKYIFILLLQRKSGRIVDQMTEAAQRKKKNPTSRIWSLEEIQIFRKEVNFPW